MKYLYAILIFIVFSGCSVTHPAVTEFRIDTKVSEHDFSARGCSEISLKVAQAFSSSSLMSLDMSYGLGANKQFTYSQSQWSSAPNTAVTLEVVRLMRNLKLFKSVQVSKSRSTNDIVLETNIEDFMQYFNDTKSKSYVNVIISFSLIDLKSANVIATKTFSSRVESKSLDADGGVEALNKALLNVLNESAVWFDGTCK